MYTHSVLRLTYGPICCILFVSGICIGSVLGLLFIFMDPTLAGILAATCIALLAGLYSTFFGFIFVLTFNLLAPVLGGISLELRSSSSTSETKIVQAPNSTLSS